MIEDSTNDKNSKTMKVLGLFVVLFGVGFLARSLNLAGLLVAGTCVAVGLVGFHFTGRQYDLPEDPQMGQGS